MQFLGLGLSDRVPDAIDGLFNRFDTTLRNASYLPMSGQILDATLVTAQKQHNTNAEQADLREGWLLQDWQDKPSKLSHKDLNARWTLKFTKAKWQDDGTISATDLAVPFFGYKSHVSIDRKFCLIRKWKTNDAAANDGARLREGLWIKPIRLQLSGRTRPIAQRPMNISWTRGASQRSIRKSRISSPCHGISRNRMLENP